LADGDTHHRQQLARSLRWLADQLESGDAPQELAAVLARVLAPPALAAGPPEAWSAPMTKARMMTKLGLGHSALRTFAARQGIRPITRQLFQIRLDGLDPGTRRKLEK
jgi:hypothetical protein